MQYRKRENLTVQSVDEETLILDLDSNHIHQLNPTASFIWELCDGNMSVDRLAELFAENYGIDGASARTDVENVIRQLLDLGLIKTD
ncbi:MAG: PqqD family protein [Gammaproteobacteria bacterium]|nr:PqqD family protein [Gammaproteobacteria bacterium]